MMPPVRDDQDSMDDRNNFLLSTGTTANMESSIQQSQQQSQSELSAQLQIQQQQQQHHLAQPLPLPNNGQQHQPILSKAELRKVGSILFSFFFFIYFVCFCEFKFLTSSPSPISMHDS